MQFTRTKACNECPFRKTSAPGYVGPYEDAAELVATASHVDFPCHKTMKGTPRDPACYGAVVMMSKSACLSRDPEIAAYQRLCGTEDETIMNKWETIERHG